MTPEHAALLGYLIALIGAPVLAIMLVALSVTQGTRWVDRTLALIILVPWVPLLLGAPRILAMLS